MVTELTTQQIADIGETIGKVVRQDLGKHITELLPDAFKHHGLDLEGLKHPVQRPRLFPSVGEGLAGAERLPQSHRLGYYMQMEQRLRAMGMTLARDSQWESFGEFLTALHPNVIRSKGLDTRLKALGEGTGSLGGFLVPEAFIANLLMVAHEVAVFRPRAQIIPMATETVRIPAIHETSRATTLFGGVQMYWTAEAASLTTSDPAFRQILLAAQKLTGSTIVGNELLADSAISLEALITRIFGEAVAFFEDDAFFDGTGAGQPQGILNTPALVSVAKETGQAANTIVTENLDKMYSRMLPSSLNKAVWLAHPNTQPQLFALARSVGAGGSAVMVTNIANAPATSIYGRPVIITEKCKTVGSLGDIYFADLSYYLIGDRGGMTMDASQHVRFTTDEMQYRVVERVAGQSWLNSAITPREGTTTLSPFIALAVRA